MLQAYTTVALACIQSCAEVPGCVRGSQLIVHQRPCGIRSTLKQASELQPSRSTSPVRFACVRPEICRADKQHWRTTTRCMPVDCSGDCPPQTPRDMQRPCTCAVGSCRIHLRAGKWYSAPSGKCSATVGQQGGIVRQTCGCNKQG